MSITPAQKEIRKNSRNLNLCKLTDLAEEHGYTLKHITDYQVRVNGILDVYPTRLKYFYLPTKEWGTLTSDLFEKKIIRLLEQQRCEWVPCTDTAKYTEASGDGRLVKVCLAHRCLLSKQKQQNA